VQDEREPLGGRQRLQHHQQSQADRVREQRLLLRIVALVDADDRLGEPRADIVLTAGPPGSEHVNADAADHGREPAADVVDIVAVRAAESQPCLLHGVVGLTHGAEHAVSDRPQAGAMRLELRRLPTLFVHLTAFRQSTLQTHDEHCDADVTDREPRHIRSRHVAAIRHPFRSTYQSIPDSGGFA
jgi:hypothetical protein